MAVCAKTSLLRGPPSANFPPKESQHQTPSFPRHYQLHVGGACILLHINAELSLRSKNHCMWRYVGSYETIPNDRDLMVAVIDGDELHIVEFPCRWREGCWIEANTGRMIDVRPTHWRQWSSE